MNINITKRQLILGILLLLIIILTISYAYFAILVDTPAETDINLGSGNVDQLDFIEGDPLNLYATLANFGETNGSLTTSTITKAKLTAGLENNNVTENYNVIFEITDNTFIYSIDNSTPEILLEVSDPDRNKITNVTGLTYKTVVDKDGVSHSGFDITTFIGSVTIYDNYEISTSTVAGVTQEWSVKITFINHNKNQVNNTGKNMDASLVLKQDNSGDSINVHNQVKTLHNGVDGTEDIYFTNDSEYRYNGAEVNNYVVFNDELWRIVGVFDENTHGISNSELVKLVKDEYIGTYSYDTENDNSWYDDLGGASLYQLLNNNYYNSTVASTGLSGCNNSALSMCDFTTTGLDSNARKMIQEVTWKLGSTSTYPSGTPSEVYLHERSNSVSLGTNNTVTANIGLLYPSDYGYAAPNNNWTSSMQDYSGIKSDIWISKNISEWLLTSHTSINTYQWFIADNGSVYVGEASVPLFIRPSVYLKSGVKIVSGTGTELDPYILTI